MPFNNEGGYTTTPQSEFLQEMKDKIIQLWPEANLNDMSDLGILANMAAALLSVDENTFLQVFHESFIQSATGDNLDKRLEDFFFSRRNPTKSVVTLEITGKENNIVPAGFMASSTTGITFETLQDLSLTSGDTFSVLAQSIDVGSQTNVAANSITNIETSLSFVYKVNNPNGAVGGLDLESDAELKERFYSQSGQISLNGLIKKLSLLEGVTRVWVVENPTNTQDIINDLPPHSTEIVISGGDNIEIAQFILDECAFSSRYVGDTEVSLVDASGTLRKVGFSRPEPLEVFVTIDIKRVDENFDQQDFLDLARELLVPYINNFTGDRLVEWEALNIFQGKIRVLDINLYFSTKDGEKGDVYLNRPSKNIFTTSDTKINIGTLNRYKKRKNNAR